MRHVVLGTGQKQGRKNWRGSRVRRGRDF